MRFRAPSLIPLRHHLSLHLPAPGNDTPPRSLTPQNQTPLNSQKRENRLRPKLRFTTDVNARSYSPVCLPACLPVQCLYCKNERTPTATKTLFWQLKAEDGNYLHMYVGISSCLLLQQWMSLCVCVCVVMEEEGRRGKWACKGREGSEAPFIPVGGDCYPGL